MTERTRYCSRCLTTFQGDPETCPNLSCKTKRRKEGWGELLTPGDVLDRHYRVERHLAIGGAGVTYLGQQIDESNEPIGPKLAIKVLYIYRDQGPYLRRLATEAQILQELIHPNIVRTMGFVNRSGSLPYLLTRFEAGGSLLDHLRRIGYMPIRIVAAMGVQLCEALDLAHQKGVIHRDLKPENILLAAEAGAEEVPLARITDFGIAKVFGGVGERITRVGAFVGTPQYAAPEQFEGLTPTPATDLYALAAVLAFCVTLEPFLPPDLVLDPVDTAEELRKRLPQKVAMGGTPEEIAAFNLFLAACTAAEPGDRIDVSGAKSLLKSIAEGRPGEVQAWEPSSDRPANANALPTMALREEALRASRGGVSAGGASQGGASAGGVSAGGASQSGASQAGTPEPSRGGASQAGVAEAPRSSAAPEKATPSAGPSRSAASQGGSSSQGGTSSKGLGASRIDSAAREPFRPNLDAPLLTRDGLEDLPPERDYRAVKVMVALGLLAGLCGVGAFGAAWYVAPWSLPDPLRKLLPRPEVLDPNDPADAADYQAILKALRPAWTEIKGQCKIPDKQAVMVDLTIEPTGGLRELAVGGLDATQSGCLARGLKNVSFGREDIVPVRAAFQFGG